MPPSSVSGLGKESLIQGYFIGVGSDVLFIIADIIRLQYVLD